MVSAIVNERPSLPVARDELERRPCGSSEFTECRALEKRKARQFGAALVGLMPVYNEESEPQWGDRAYDEKVYGYYREPPYWGAMT